MKITKHLIILLILFGWYLSIDLVSAAAVNIAWSDTIKAVSIQNTNSSWDVVEDINAVWFSLLTMFKVILQWLMMIYIVYIGITMVISMWTDEDKLSKSKNQLWYTIVALIFINIPGTLYLAFQPQSWRTIDNGIVKNSEYLQEWVDGGNLFVNLDSFWTTDWIMYNIIWFMEVLIWWVAVFMIIFAWINIMISRWRDEKVSEAKNKIIASIFALVFVWFIEAWVRLIRWGNINGWDTLADWTSFFWTAVNLALYLAGPIALFFLTLAGYYYITSNGDEDRVKKAKSIIVNTLIWWLLLLVMFTFLVDLDKLTF